MKNKNIFDMNELVDIVLNKTNHQSNHTRNELLRKNNLNEDQWNSFVSMIEDLDLNKQGAMILLEEIKSGKVILPS